MKKTTALLLGFVSITPLMAKAPTLMEQHKKLEEQANNQEQDALLRIGQLYYKGRLNTENEPNYTLARLFFEKAHKAGSAEAAYYLGRIYMTGAGVDMDEAKALHYFKEGVKLGSQKAAKKTKELGVEAVEKTKELGQKAADKTKEAAQKVKEKVEG